MTPRREFQKVLAVLAATYPKFELTQPTIAAYHAVLGDIEADLLKAATLHLAATSKWFPTASEIRDTAFELVERQSGMPDAAQAWEAVMREIGKAGYYRTPDFGHPVIGKAVDAIGGFRNVCMSPNPVAERARFLQAFETIIRRERAEVRKLPQVKEIAAKYADAKRLTDGDNQNEIG